MEEIETKVLSGDNYYTVNQWNKFKLDFIDFMISTALLLFSKL